MMIVKRYYHPIFFLKDQIPSLNYKTRKKERKKREDFSPYFRNGTITIVISCEYLFSDAVDFDYEIFLVVSISKSYNHHNCIWLFLFQYHRWCWDQEVLLLLVLQKSL
jgi:hypothetical protein